MKIQKISKIKSNRQDGAISNGFLFSFNRHGECSVYEMKALACPKDADAEVFAEFVLDKNELLSPHSNAVVFGNEYYDAKDEFPLLYANVYNNYAKAEDKLKGVCLVYRVQREDRAFATTLVQMIEIGFVENDQLWKSSGEKADVRPYGNFVIDAENSIYYGFTMRDSSQTTRVFSFALPKVNQGELCPKYNVKRVILQEADILDWFDVDYQQYVQGACFHKGKIYSLEGFTDHLDHPPALRIIDTKEKKQICLEMFKDHGTTIEPEMIDFENDNCYYTDNHGNVYKVSF